MWQAQRLLFSFRMRCVWQSERTIIEKMTAYDKPNTAGFEKARLFQQFLTVSGGCDFFFLFEYTDEIRTG